MHQSDTVYQDIEWQSIIIKTDQPPHLEVQSELGVQILYHPGRKKRKEEYYEGYLISQKINLTGKDLIAQMRAFFSG